MKRFYYEPYHKPNQDQVKTEALNLYSFIYLLTNFKGKIYPQFFFVFSLLQMPNVIGKKANFLLTKFTPNAGKNYLKFILGVNLR